jgi:hypothetical protein
VVELGSGRRRRRPGEGWDISDGLPQLEDVPVRDRLNPGIGGLLEHFCRGPSTLGKRGWRRVLFFDSCGVLTSNCGKDGQQEEGESAPHGGPPYLEGGLGLNHDPSFNAWGIVIHSASFFFS